MNIEEIKRKHQGEWLAIRVTREVRGKPVEGELVATAKDRDEIWRKVKIGKEPIYVTFAGPPLKKGYIAAFRG